MSFSRRNLLAGGALGSAALALGGCDQAYMAVAGMLGGGMPDSFGSASSETIDPAFHVLSRISFGPRPGDLDRIREIGTDAYIEEQLNPDALEDRACELLARRFESLYMKAGNIYEFKKPVAAEELVRATVIRAALSRRQLFEVMVGFWTDHLNLDQSKAECAWLKTADDRDVIRKHALGKFQDLIRASAVGPAMLVYLDGQANRYRTAVAPNENYARELFELHTMGVNGGYTQKDVMEVARCLTGWTVSKTWNKGSVSFEPKFHDNGEKIVLGKKLPAGGGERDLDAVLDLVTLHPSTAKYVAWKLCRRFVADHPSKELVERVTGSFTRSDGDIRATLRTLLGSEEFRQAKGIRFKRPFRYIVSALRALAAETTVPSPLIRYFDRMGHLPFAYPTPDGYPDETEPWLGAFLWRWNYALELASGRISGVDVHILDLQRSAGADDPLDLFPHFVGRAPTSAERTALAGHDPATTVGLILASPAFQRF